MPFTFGTQKPGPQRSQRKPGARGDFMSGTRPRTRKQTLNLCELREISAGSAVQALPRWDQKPGTRRSQRKPGARGDFMSGTRPRTRKQTLNLCELREIPASSAVKALSHRDQKPGTPSGPGRPMLPPSNKIAPAENLPGQSSLQTLSLLFGRYQSLSQFLSFCA